jgi:hypothetical protein
VPKPQSREALTDAFGIHIFVEHNPKMIELASFCAVAHTSHHHHVTHHSNAQQVRQTFVLLARPGMLFPISVAGLACLGFALLQSNTLRYCTA